MFRTMEEIDAWMASGEGEQYQREVGTGNPMAIRLQHALFVYIVVHYSIEAEFVHKSTLEATSVNPLDYALGWVNWELGHYQDSLNTDN